MALPDEFREKPIECACASALILLGIGAGFVTDKPWIPPIGNAAAALGGALLSYAVSSVNLRKRAAEALEPELQTMARHLADTTAKLSRAIQSYYQGDSESEITIDRIAQLISSLYSSLNDIHVIAGSTTNFQTLVETVKGCEDMAARLEELTNRAGGAPLDELEKLREQLEGARLQLDSARKSLGDTISDRREENVVCPHCASSTRVILGTNQGDSGVGSCSACLQRFHVHRGIDGKSFSRAMGTATAPPGKKPIDVECPGCHSEVRINFDTSRETESRFCMVCCSKLTVLPDGQIVGNSKEEPVKTETVGWIGNRQVLKCPKCNGTFKALWGNAEFARGACSACGILLETRRQWKNVPFETSVN